jgi:UV DNA damage endonuclease
MLRSFSRIPLRIAHRVPERSSSAHHSFYAPSFLLNMAKRKRSTAAAESPAASDAPAIDRSKMRRSEVPLPPNVAGNAPKASRRQSSRGATVATMNPDINPDVLDGVTALRASPDGHECDEQESHLKPHPSNSTMNGISAATEATAEISPPSKASTNTNGVVEPSSIKGASAGKGKRKTAGAQQVKTEPKETSIGSVTGIAKNVTAPTKDTGMAGDPEDAEGLEEDEVEVKEALSRPPPVNSEYLPLPWKGRLGYVRIPHTFHATMADFRTRRASTHIFALQILPCSVLGHAASQASSNTVIP